MTCGCMRVDGGTFLGEGRVVEVTVGRVVAVTVTCVTGPRGTGWESSSCTELIGSRSILTSGDCLSWRDSTYHFGFGSVLGGVFTSFVGDLGLGSTFGGTFTDEGSLDAVGDDTTIELLERVTVAVAVIVVTASLSGLDSLEESRD